MANSKLLTRTLELVRERPRSVTYREIGKKTKISESWLQALMSGKIDDPGVNKIERLYTYFTKNPLVL